MPGKDNKYAPVGAGKNVSAKDGGMSKDGTMSCGTPAKQPGAPSSANANGDMPVSGAK